jgi:hypothetical protein
MATEEIDAYLAGLEEPKRSTLADLRQTLVRIMPEAEQGISYGMPAFRLSLNPPKRTGMRPDTDFELAVDAIGVISRPLGPLGRGEPEVCG